MIRAILPCYILLTCTWALAEDTKAPGKNQEANIKWAKGVATDFLTMATDPSYQVGDAAALVCREFYDGIKDRSWTQVGKLGRYKLAEITNEELSPDGNEVVFSGVLRDSRFADEKEGAFRLRVAKEQSCGLWQVRSVVVTERDAKATQIEDASGTQEGTLVKAGGDKITIKYKDAKEYAYDVYRDAKVHCDDKACTIDDLKKGVRVKLTVEKGKVTEIVAKSE